MKVIFYIGKKDLIEKAAEIKAYIIVLRCLIRPLTQTSSGNFAVRETRNIVRYMYTVCTIKHIFLKALTTRGVYN